MSGGGTLASRVRAALERGPLDVQKFCAKEGVDAVQVRRAVANMRRQGNEVVTEGGGRYRLVTAASTARADRAKRAVESALSRVSGSGGGGEEENGAAPRRRRRAAGADAPALGERLQVVGLALERGAVVVRLAGDGGRGWSAVVRKALADGAGDGEGEEDGP